MKTTSDFFNKVCQEIDKKYFPEVKYYRDNEQNVKVHYAVELFNNGCLGYSELIKRISTATKETRHNIHNLVSKFITDFEDFEYYSVTNNRTIS